jgi:nucleotide-binding universal stress UspA family protein
MKQILVATDFSNNAANAMEYAMWLAKTLKLDLCALHAIHPTEGINNNVYDAIFIEDYYDKKRAELKDWAAAYTAKDEFKEINVSTICGVGFLKNVITKYIDENHVELLVMGVTESTGMSGIIASNTDVIVSIVNIPTLIVPIESKFSSVPVITLATDYETKFSADDVNAVNEMLLAFGSAKLQILYVTEKTDEKHIAVGESRIKELFKNTELEFNYIHDSSPLSGIMGYIEKNETDILCLVKHHHNVVYRIFNIDTVNRVMNRTVKAVLVLHE